MITNSGVRSFSVSFNKIGPLKLETGSNVSSQI